MSTRCRYTADSAQTDHSPNTQSADHSAVIMQLGDIARTAIENGYPENGPLTAEQYVQAVREAYQFGQKGMRASLNQGSGLTGKLDNTVRIAAYHAGKTAGGDQIAIETAKVQNRALPGPKDAGVVHYDGDRSRLTQLQQTSLSALDGLAKALGKDFHIYESTLKERVQGKANGWYDPRDSSIHIDLDAGADGKGTMLFTASHELTHYIRDWSPAKYRALSDFLFEKYGEKDISIDDLISREYYYQRQQAHNKGLSHRELYSLATEEVVAKSMEKMLADGSVAEKLTELKQKDRSLYQKIKDCISDLAKKIREVYKGLNPDSEEGQLVGKMQDSIDQIQQLFAEGLDDASQNEQAAKERGVEQAEKNTTRNGVVKYSIRYTQDNKPVVVIQKDILQGVPKNQWIATVKNSMAQFNGGIPIFGKLVRVNKASRDEFNGSKYTQRLRSKKGSVYADKMRSANNLDEIVRATTNYINEDLKHKRKDSFVEFARGDVNIRIGTNDYTAKVIVGFTSGRQMVLYDLIDFVAAKFVLKK